MPLILNIDTATETCSACLCEGSELLAHRVSSTGNQHSSSLQTFIDEILDEIGKSYSDIDAVAVSKGPGSYTGLRIGISTAKGICYAQNIPLISVGNLDALASSYIKINDIGQNDYVVPMIDARRMEVYTSIYNSKMNQVSDTKALVLSNESYAEELSSHFVHFIGNGSGKLSGLQIHKNYTQSDLSCDSKHMRYLSSEAYEKSVFENLAYFTPEYLKPYQVGVSKK